MLPGQASDTSLVHVYKQLALYEEILIVYYMYFPWCGKARLYHPFQLVHAGLVHSKHLGACCTEDFVVHVNMATSESYLTSA